jgi:uncharacterized protein
MFLKLIIFALLIYGVYRFLGRELPSLKQKSKDESDNSEKQVDTLIECATCSTYVTKVDAIKFRGNYYCSKECLPK